jgi:GNAT superfamily N-acetyltransferase
VQGEVELAYFGLVPECIGRGLGGWLLDVAIDRAWSMRGTRRLWVHTCSLDHPRALGQYERAGFVRIAERRDVIWDPRPLPIVPR